MKGDGEKSVFLRSILIIMTLRGRNITLVVVGVVLALAVCLFTFGKRTKVVEGIKKQTATLMKKEFIPDQHVNLEETMAFAQADSVHDQFRKHFRMHYQTIGTATFADSSRILMIAEPAPFFEPDSLERICEKFTHETVRKQVHIGYDGRMTDIMVLFGNTTTENLNNLVTKISKQLYLSDYKPNAIDLKKELKRSYFTRDNLDYQISLAEFDDWFFQAAEVFIDDKDTSKTLTINKMFEQKRKGVFFSKAPGLVAWCIRRNSDLINQAGDIRRFALDADLILGALRDSTTLVIIGREREAPLEVLPPLRVETVLLIASISAKELSQSLDINDCMAGKMGDGRDWCPTYLSRELENTELGHLLTITDVLLKDWSESGTIQEACYHYPSPGYFPFDRPLFQKLGINQLVYNWNTANTMYAIDLPEHTIYTLNRTGALPVSYFNSQESHQSVGSSYERQAGNYFANCGNTDIVRVVQYTALYQLFMDNGIHYKGMLLHSVFPANKPYLLAKPCRNLLDLFKNMDDSQIQQFADTLARIHFDAYGQKQVNKQMADNENRYNFTYTEENRRDIYQDVNQRQKQMLISEMQGVRSMLKGLSEENLGKLARYLSYPRGTTINSQESYNRMLQARKVNNLLRTIGKNNLKLIGLDLAKIKDYYVGSLSKSGGRYLKTPSVIITYNDMVTTGGHNISSRISRVGSTTNYKATGGSGGTHTYPAPTSKPVTTQPSTSKPTGTPNKSASPSKPNTSTGSKSTTPSKPATTQSRSIPSSGTVRSRSTVVSSAARSSRGF